MAVLHSHTQLYFTLRGTIYIQQASVCAHCPHILANSNSRPQARSMKFVGTITACLWAFHCWRYHIQFQPPIILLVLLFSSSHPFLINMCSCGDLPLDMYTHIVSLVVPSAIPRNNIASLSHSWRLASGICRIPQLPWLLIPRTCPESSQPVSGAVSESVYCLKCSHTHRIHLRRILRGSMHIGSPRPEWIMVAINHIYDHVLLNVRTGHSITIAENFYKRALDRRCRMLIRTATLSSGAIDATNCFVASLSTIFLPAVWSGRSLVSFSRLGSSFSTEGIFGEFEDVIWFRESFYTISRGANIVVSTPDTTIEEPGFLVNFAQFLLASLGLNEPVPGYLVSRYLVESRGQLLMISWYSPKCAELTSCFHVHKLQHIHLVGRSGDIISYNQVNDLTGRILFAGRGSPCSYETKDHPDIEEGVYFHNDRSFSVWRMIYYGANSNRRYPLNDNGHWVVRISASYKVAM